MRNLIFIGVLSLLFLSCKKDIDELKRITNNDFTVVDWEPTFAVPIIDTRTTLGELFTELDTLIKELEEENLFLSINNDNLFVAKYKFVFESGGLKEYYTIETHSDQLEVIVPQKTLDVIANIPVGLPITPTIFDTVLVFDIEPQYGALLEYIELSGGSINIEYNHNFNQNLGMDVTIRSITERGSNDTVRFNFPGLASNPSNSGTLELTNHNVDLSYFNPVSGQIEYNKLEIYVAANGLITNSTLNGDRFTIDFSIGDYTVDYIQGYLGDFDTQLPSGDFKFDIFEELEIEGITIKEPRIDLDIKSTLGLPTTIRIDTFAVGYADNRAPASLGVDGDIVQINGVTNRSDVPNNPARSSYAIDNTSQLDELISTQPNTLFYSLNASSVPSNSPTYEFFLVDTSHIAIDLTAEIPLDFAASNYERFDTIKLVVGDSLGSLGNDEDSIVDLFEKAQIKLIFENQIPLDIELQGFLIDSTGAVIDQVFEGGPQTILRNTNIDANGVAQSAQDVVTFIELDQAKFEKVIQSSNLVLHSKAKTSNTGNVKLLSTYQFGIRAGVLAKFKVPVNLELNDN